MNEPLESTLQERAIGCKNLVCYCPLCRQLNCQKSTREFPKFTASLTSIIHQPISCWVYFTIAEERLLRRAFVLPHIHFCPYHEVALVSTCKCGVVLQLFSRYSQPFICHDCGWEWTRLPLFPVPPERFILEQKVLSCYEFFFTRGTPQLLVRALQLIREKLKEERIVQVKLLDGTIKQVEHYELTKASLGYLVNLLVSLDLSLRLME